jgi:hypothetical protein
MKPLAFFYLLIGTTLAAAALQRGLRARRCAALRRVARELGMQYVADDRFRLTPKIAGLLPVPGAADPRVRDVMYLTEADHRRYLFTCEFGVGVVFAQCRRRRVAGFDEPLPALASSPVELRFAAEEGNLEDQYRWLARGSAERAETGSGKV